MASARFTLTLIDNDQRGGGAQHAIEDLNNQMPKTYELRGVMPGPGGIDYLCGLSRESIVYRPAADFDWSKAVHPELIRTDDRGRYLLVNVISVAPFFAGTYFHRGMRSFAVAIAFVLDYSMAQDDELTMAKVDYIGVGHIDDIPEAVNPPAGEQ